MSEQSAFRAAAPDQGDPRRDRAFGAFIGLAVGDALGTTIEFKQRDTYDHVTDLVGGGPFRLKPGEWTDDTSMALCLADSLIAHGGTIEPDDLARRFVRWWREGENSVNGVASTSATPRVQLSRAISEPADRSEAPIRIRPATAASCVSLRSCWRPRARQREPSRSLARSRT